MCDARRVQVLPYAVALKVTSSNERERRAGKINGSERPMVEQISVSHATAIGVTTEDCARRANSGGAAADRAGRIETCESAVGRDKT